MNKLKIILQSNIFAIFLILVTLGYSFYSTCLKKYETKYFADTTEIRGEVLNFKINEERVSITLKALEKVVITYYIKDEETKKYLEDNLKIGSFIIGEGKKKDILEPTIFNTFNYKKYLYNEYVYFTFTANKISISNDNLSVFNKIKWLINKRIDKVERKEYLKAFILGDKNYIDEDINDIIRNNGVSHLFALSGMHVNFVWLILKKLKVNNILIFLFLFIYYIIAGEPVSFLRALLFMILIKMNKKFNWNISNIKLLLYLAICLIWINPFIIYNTAFIYTFIVTFSLLLFSKYFKLNGYFKNTLAVSIITFLFSLPITLYLTYEINLISPFLNVVLVPLVSLFIFPLTILVFFFPILNPIYSKAIWILESLNILMTNISLNVVVGKITFLEIGLYYLFLILLIVKKKIRYLFLLGLISFFMHFKYNLDPNFYSYYLDVGQGDSEILIMPFKKYVVMIDTGGKVLWQKDSNSSSSLIANTLTFLKSKGIDHLDYVIFTHGDYDHMGEAINLVNNFKIKKVIFNCGEYNALEQSLINVLKEKNIAYDSCIYEINLNKNKLIFLNTKVYDNENDNSNVIYFKYNTYQFLYMGDAEISKENDILKSYNLSNIDFLKIGHHGSDTSSSKVFIDQMKPKYSLISVGRNNSYGHPKSSVLKNLNNSIIYRTDINGSIEVRVKGKKSKIKSCLN